jgi:sulfur-oxidizing protein SoxX
MRKRLFSLAVLVLAACASGPSDEGVRQRAEQVFRESFTHGNRQMAAKVDQQDEVQALCTRYRSEPPKEVADRIEATETGGIRYPASGKFLGDWRKGEKIAQDGYGLRFTDPDTKRPNGGGCYNCHRIAPAEISYGTVGPSLYRFGAQRGAGEPAHAALRPPRHPHRGADHAPRRSAARPGVPGQQMTR